MKATVFDIERNSYVDGPGIRTTVFFKGCNLRCQWCHNPESQRREPELMLYANKCVGCGRCRDVSLEDREFFCYHDAREICGREYDAEEILDTVMKDKAFYDASGGGVTFSGGECMLQIDPLAELLMACGERGIHTAVDTAGQVDFSTFERIMPHTDLFLYDIKCFDSEKHKKYTGVGNERILENLKRLLTSGARVWVRIPVIPEVNDSVEEMESIKSFLDEIGAPEKIELLPYHAMGEHKYAAIGRETPSFATPTDELMEKLRAVFGDL